MPGYTFHLIPHTHWDREWYLPRSVFQARLVAALDDLLPQLESEADSTFLLDGQTVLVEDYLRVRPDQAPRISELVRAGRLQIGPWYVLADELIPSGESLIRNLLAGQIDADRWGMRSDVLYSPDAFGHPAAWPQLAGEFGMRYGVIWRGLGGKAGQERDLYRWRGPDGREVLLYHLPPDGYEIGAALPADRDHLPQVWNRIRGALVSRATTQHIAVFVGADHHAAHPNLSRLRALLRQLEPESDFRLSRLCDFFGAISAAGAGLPVLSGELRWSYGYTWTLQGVHGTRAPLKRRHSLAELALIGIAEPLTALALATRGTDQRATLQFAWRTLLRSQFHDSIAGTTSDEVTRHVELRLADARAVAWEVARTSLDSLVGNDPDQARVDPAGTAPRLVLWNPIPRRRGGVIVSDVTWFRRDVLVGPSGGRASREGAGLQSFHFAGDRGPLAVQLLGVVRDHERLDASRHYPDQDEVDRARVAFVAPEVSGLGFSILTTRGGTTRAPETGVWLRGNRMGNDLIELSVGRGGALRLKDRKTRQVYSNLLTLESGGDIGDTYTYSPPPKGRLHRSRGRVSLRPLARGPLVAALEASWRMRAGGPGKEGSVGVRLTVSLYAGSPAVRCTLRLDNRATDHRLRARIPTGLAGVSATAGTQFGIVERPPVRIESRGYVQETPVATAPGQRFVAAVRKNRGLALFAPGFFEYQLDASGDIVLTLLRAVGSLSRSDLSTRPGHAGWPLATPLAQSPGLDQLQLGLVPVTHGDIQAGVIQQHWEDLFLPVRGIWLRQATSLSPQPIDIALQGAGLVFSALKPATTGRGLVLRCFNSRDEAAAGAWQFATPVRTAHRTRADERPLHEIRLGDGGHLVPFHAAPHEIVTVMVSLGSTD
ncbi:MAG TPA: glycoside hydrolase family 38 C-terminal domain-containing protein [Gemmatimonadales bacterium]|nr:glycoside hydrolase family 38 C-terminal domain-containing protein [Gemmatimonadales bacterium]